MTKVTGRPVKACTIGFDEEEYDELCAARAFASQIRADHNFQVVKPQAMEVLEKLIWHYDEPFA